MFKSPSFQFECSISVKCVSCQKATSAPSFLNFDILVLLIGLSTPFTLKEITFNLLCAINIAVNHFPFFRRSLCDISYAAQNSSKQTVSKIITN